MKYTAAHVSKLRHTIPAIPRARSFLLKDVEACTPRYLNTKAKFSSPPLPHLCTHDSATPPYAKGIQRNNDATTIPA